MLQSRHIAGYTRENLADHDERSEPLVVNCAGWYRDVSAGEWECRRPQGRRDYLLMLVSDGSETMYRDGRRLELRAGDLALIRPREPQHIHCDMSRSSACWVHFSGRDCGQELANAGIDQPVVHIGATPEFEAGVLRIIDEILARRHHAGPTCVSLLRLCFLCAGRKRWEIEHNVQPRGGSLEPVIAWINEHYREPLTITQLARRAHLSRSAFTRAFTAMCGVSPISYVIRLRMQQARNLLTRHDVPIKQVAAEVGYDNQLYFSRLFSRHTGASPLGYRTQHR